MVGYRNTELLRLLQRHDFIRHSDGGVSEPYLGNGRYAQGLYQAFRWWGIGTLLGNP